MSVLAWYLAGVASGAAAVLLGMAVAILWSEIREARRLRG